MSESPCVTESGELQHFVVLSQESKNCESIRMFRGFPNECLVSDDEGDQVGEGDFEFDPDIDFPRLADSEELERKIQLKLFSGGFEGDLLYERECRGHRPYNTSQA